MFSSAPHREIDLTSEDRHSNHTSPVPQGDEISLLRRQVSDLAAELARYRGGRAGAARMWDEVLLCEIGEHRVALPLDEILEVVPLARTRAIPGAPHFVLGLPTLRGRELPVPAEMARVSKAPRRPARDEQIVACEAGGIAFGLLTTRVLGIAQVDRGTIAELPADLMQWVGAARDRIGGVAFVAGQPVLLVSTEAIGRDARVDALLGVAR